jgi:hypothetical protein
MPQSPRLSALLQLSTRLAKACYHVIARHVVGNAVLADLGDRVRQAAPQ